MDNRRFLIAGFNHFISLMLLLVILANILLFGNYTYAESGNTKYDTVPINTEGQEGTCVSAIDYDEIYVESDTWQGIANFSIVKVPSDTAAIKWYDSEAEQYFKTNEYEFEPAGNRLDDGWWSIDTEELIQCDTIQDNQFSAFLALKESEGYCKEATYYELFDTPAPRDAGFRHFFIQVGDKNSPLDVYAGTTEMIGADYWINSSFSGDTKIELLLGAGKRHEVFSDNSQAIWYTTDGSDPTDSSTAELFSGPNPMVLTKSCVVKAATKTSEGKWGPVSAFTCNVTCNAPVITPKEGTYYEPFEATMVCGTEGAKIYYTNDGSNPLDEHGNLIEDVKEYSEPIYIDKDTVIKSVAVYNNIVSEVVTTIYNLSAALKVDFYNDDQGVWRRESTFINNRKGTIITPYGHSKCKLIATIKDGATLKLGDQVINPNEDGQYILELDSKLNSEVFEDEGQENIITVINEGKEIKYTIYCLSSLFNDLPDRIVDYFIPASQYTNYGGTIGCAPNTTLIGKCGDVFHCSSLGNFGGYIIWEYKDGIRNDPKNPYGVDFIVFGNSFDGTNEAAEPGNILVSENGTDWYTLAGSFHYDDNAIWNQKVTYTNEGGLARYEFEGLDANTPAGYFEMPSALAKFPYPESIFYPLHDGDEETFTTRGTFLVPSSDLNIFGNVRPPYPAFGYADTGLMIDGNNEAENPYRGLVRDIAYPDRVRTNRNGDACDISWAVDENGNPKKLDKIHFIKVQTASFIDNGDICEKSTEVCCMRIAKPADSTVGITSAPSSINIDGTEVALKPGEVVDATVDGIFDITVDAPETANVYINSLRSHTAFMDKAPHGIVRVIVQEGGKEPLIYYFKINQNAQQTSKKVTAITFDTGKGLMQDKEKLTCYFDADTIEHLGVEGEVVLPKAVSPKENEGFAYWYNEDNEKQYAAYNAGNAAKLNGKTLTAVYGKAEDVEAASAVAEAIENLPEADSLAIEDADVVKAAQEAYDDLTDDQKKLISDADKTKLALASATIDKLEAEQKLKDLQTENDISDTELEKAKDELKEAKTKLAIMQKTVKKVKSKAKKKSALVSWKSVGKGFTYEVYRSTNPIKSFKKVKTLKKLKVTVKKLKKGKTYYFKVRAFKKVNGKKVYTGWSNIAKAKIKK